MNKNLSKGVVVAAGLLATAATIFYVIQRSVKDADLKESISTWVHNEDRKWVHDAEAHAENETASVYADQPDEYVDVTEETVNTDENTGLRTVTPEELEAELIDDSRIIVGDGEGEISRTSKEYRELINDAYGKAISGEEPVLVLYGKTNGLGARGEILEADADGVKGRLYKAEDIIKLRNRMLQSK